MLRFHCVVVFTVFVCSPLIAGEPEFSGRHAIQQDLFANSNPNSIFGSLSVQSQEATQTRKSVGLAVLYSLLLPGLGEHYADGFSSGKYFSIADAQFFVDIGNFLNTTEFDEKRNRERDPQRTYGNRAGYSWNWGPAELPQSDINRALYKDQRISGDNMLNNRKFVIAAIVINHVASAINAARMAISYNREITEQSSHYQFKADVLGGLSNPHGVMLTVSRSF